MTLAQLGTEAMACVIASRRVKIPRLGFRLPPSADLQPPLRRFFVIVVEKTIPSRRQRFDLDRGLGVAGDHLLETKRLALEFRLGGIHIRDFDLEGLSRRRDEFGRHEAMALQRDFQYDGVIGERRRASQSHERGKSGYYETILHSHILSP